MKRSNAFVLAIVILLVSLTVQAQQFEIEIKPGPGDNKDAYLNLVNYYAQPFVQSNIASAWTHSGEIGKGRSFIQFALPQIPDNATIVSASLNLYHDYSSAHIGHYGDNAGKIEKIIDNWSLNNLNWDNQPAVSEINSVSLPVSDSSNQNYQGIDVLNLILDSYTNSEDSIGFRLSLITEVTYRSLVFASGDHPDESIRPSLVIIYDTCSQLNNDFSYEINGLQCQFTYDDNSATSIIWNFGNGYGSFVQNPYYVYPEEGTYLVCMQATSSCDTITICKEINVCQIPIANFSYIIEGLNVVFTNLTEPEGSSYYWEFGNDFFSIVTNPEFEYENYGEYEVCLTSFNPCGEWTFYCETITIAELLTKKSSNEAESFIIYPNPSKDYINIEPIGDLPYSIYIYSASGVLIDSFDSNHGINRYSISNYPTGYYVVKFVTNQEATIKKFLKH